MSRATLAVISPDDYNLSHCSFLNFPTDLVVNSTRLEREFTYDDRDNTQAFTCNICYFHLSPHHPRRLQAGVDIG